MSGVRVARQPPGVLGEFLGRERADRVAALGQADRRNQHRGQIHRPEAVERGGPAAQRAGDGGGAHVVGDLLDVAEHRRVRGGRHPADEVEGVDRAARPLTD
jgi:hypothetical protein